MFIRLTALLCAGLYGSMLLFGTEQPGTATASAAAPEPADPVASRAAASPSAAPVAVSVGVAAAMAETVTPTAASLSADAPDDTVSLDGLIRIASFDAPAEIPQASGIDVVEVTGTVVNLRAGPSTANDVVARLRQGARAELIETAADGWMQIRDLDSGAQGYMSGDYLSRVTPG